VVGEVTVTLVTVAPRPLTRWMRLLRAAENAVPFCSSPTRSEFGVLELKNFSQFAAISASATAVPEEDDDAGADDAGAEVAGADELDDEPELLQAATASASARPSAGTRMIRRATRGNRIALLSLGRMYY
jgi:hypothetical protein